ncbi:hypothetical protein L195_g051798, partial [Trifolium pratense]
MRNFRPGSSNFHPGSRNFRPGRKKQQVSSVLPKPTPGAPIASH